MIERGLEQLYADGTILFLPHVGPRYEAGLAGKRLLIVGESHYNGSRELDSTESRTFTRAVVSGFLNPDERGHDESGRPRRSPELNFFRKIAESLRRATGINEPERDRLFDRLAFANYHQFGMGLRAKLAVDIRHSRNGPAFRALLKTLQPDYALVYSYKAFRQLLADCLPNADRDSQHAVLDGVPLLRLPHTSSGFSYAAHCPRIAAFLNGETPPPIPPRAASVTAASR